jgi:lipopolysaccharide transport system permease protein
MFNLSELWNRRSLIWNFAITDLKLRYRNSILGFMWNFLEPLLLLSILYFVFTNIFKGDIEQYPLYLLLGIIMWNFLSKGTTIGLNSIVGRSGIITQIYFPKEIFAISSTITATIMLGFELLVLGIFMIIFQFLPPVTLLYLPLFLILEVFLVLGLSLALSVLNVYYKDIQFIWGVVIHAGFFSVPIFYTLSILSDDVRELVLLNPMARLIDMAHNVTLYGIMPSIDEIGYTVLIILVIFSICYGIFRKFEKHLVEEL